MVNEMMGTDIALDTSNDISFNSNNDLVLINDISNLRQAVFNRLMTVKGFFSRFPIYGSQLYKVLGKQQDNSLLLYSRALVYEALLQEPRINTIDNIDVQFINMYTINISISGTVIGSVNPFNFVYDFFL